ncbi:MAG: hypothetical protein JXA09_02440 [Anaerolineae bacterium]|nr:hypothetical protein [Anaerolineae bacterium]
MAHRYLKYEFSDGWIAHWLVAGPHATPAEGVELSGEGDARLDIVRRYHDPASGIDAQPVERATFSVGDAKLEWRYYRCLDDHFVDLTGFYHTPHYLCAWAYAEVVCPAPYEGAFVLTTNGPADVWIDGRHVHRHEHTAHQAPRSVSFQSALRQGANGVLVRLEAGAIRASPFVMALRIPGLPAPSGALAREQQALWASGDAFRPAPEEVPDGASLDEARVYLPTAAPLAARQRMLESIFAEARVDQRVHFMGNKVMLRWDRDLARGAQYAASIQDNRSRIYVEAQDEAKGDARIDVGHPVRIWEGSYDVVIRPSGIEWFEQNTRYERRIPIHILDHAYTNAPYGAYADRRAEGLAHAAKHPRNVYTEIAKMALGQWSEVDVDHVMAAIDGINARRDCSDFDLIGLLGALYRHGSDPDFPDALRAPLEACILGFKYWQDEPGVDSMCYDTENHSILFHACEILAGQLYPDRVFANVGQTGAWHREKGERLALQWLAERGATGFAEWHSNCYFEEDLVALSHLLDLAEHEEVQELSVLVMDKLFFTIAVNSFKGTFGATHGRSYAPMVLSGQLEATSGISRLMWGMGVWNQHIRGLVSLACSEYELAPVLADIAADASPEMWDREQHRGVNTVTYRTPDYMLSSVQDYRRGEPGSQEHVWQATMGPDAVVFVTHPSSMSEVGARRPNFWAGNVVLPRVAQWKDVLVAIHRLPEDDWMGFTHAYWPCGALDEYRLRQGWAFGRKGRAYLALTASQGLTLVTSGPSAYRELRSPGAENVWLCMMGRPDTDGSFEDFQRAVLALNVDVQGLAVRCTTHRGRTLSFGWDEPFLVDGEAQLLGDDLHYDNPFCSAEYPCERMEIRTSDYLLRLRFAPEEGEDEA